jgi:hypothetical protein
MKTKREEERRSQRVGTDVNKDEKTRQTKAKTPT